MVMWFLVYHSTDIALMIHPYGKPSMYINVVQYICSYALQEHCGVVQHSRVPEYV